VSSLRGRVYASSWLRAQLRYLDVRYTLAWPMTSNRIGQYADANNVIRPVSSRNGSHTDEQTAGRQGIVRVLVRCQTSVATCLGWVACKLPCAQVFETNGLTLFY